MERTVERTVNVLRQLDAHKPDLIEIRFDLMKSATKLSQIRNATDRLLIATNRRKDEAGLFSGTEEDRLATLQQAADESFDYVDIELKTENLDKMIHRVEENGSSVIVSYHNERSTPSTNVLSSILAREKRTGADICKIVTTAKSYHDSLRCLEFVSIQAPRSRLVCFAMGRFGIPSRVLSPMFGAYFTFASYASGRESAPGQLTIASMRNLYRQFQA
jgi:3-dehydroquinate dehydratase type I